MRVRLLGFEWRFGAGISCDDLFEHLETIKETQVKFRGRNRLLYLGESGDYHVGIFLTYRSQRRTCELKTEKGIYKISVRSLEKGTSLVDFNFFVIHRHTGRGIYQQYHGSCGFHKFSGFVREQYNQLKDACIERSIRDAGGETTKSIKQARRKYKGTLNAQVLVRRDALLAMLSEMKRIRSFEFELTALAASDPRFSPLDGMLRRETHRLSFDIGVNKNTLARKIASIVKDVAISKGKVSGTGANNFEQTLKLVRNPDSFGDYDFDEVADETVLNLASVEDSPFIQTMLEKTQMHRALFEAPVKG